MTGSTPSWGYVGNVGLDDSPQESFPENNNLAESVVVRVNPEPHWNEGKVRLGTHKARH